MTDIGTSSTKSTHTRALRPERIDFGNGKVAVRNDVVADEQGASVRAVNRDDPKGAPFLYICGVKYRPYPDYPDWVLANKIQRRGQASKRRSRARTRRST
jgi:hypothetical protein